MLKNWELYFLYEKRKQKDVTRRAPSSFENLIDSVKKFIQLKPSVFDLSRIDKSMMGVTQTLTSNDAFYTRFMKYYFRKYRGKGQKFFFTRDQLFSSNEKKIGNKQSNAFVLRQRGSQG